MSLLGWGRNKAFWLLDFIKGGIVAKAYDDIKKIDLMDSDNAFVAEYRRRAWLKLRENACLKTKAYASLQNCELEQFPVVTKQDIRQAQDEYLSVDYKKDELIQMSTSGSTGTPFISYQNLEKKRRVNAEVIYYSEKIGYKLGENLSYIRSLVRQNSKPRFKQFLQNQTLLDCRSLSDSRIEELLAVIRDYTRKGPVTLLAYASTYTALKDYFLEHGVEKLDFELGGGIISGSEMLFDSTREVIAKVFRNSNVVSRYSNEENGVLGQDEGINNVFAINEANYIVEILNDEGKPVEDGVLGRVVVTDLFNYAMPMIRYDTGDVGAVQTFDLNGRKKKCICSFSGRSVDLIFDANGEPFSPHTFTNTMWDFLEITQFQIVQTNQREYLLKLNAPDDFLREEELKKNLLALLGANAVVTIKRVNEIPVLSSGKRRYVVNEWKRV